MVQPFVIRIGADSGLIWRDPLGAVCRGEVSDLPPLPPGVPCVVTVPGTLVGLESVSLPRASAANLRQAVPFLLEERLALGVEELHFALGRRDGESCPVAVMERRRLAGWLERLAKVGVQPVALLAEPLLLPEVAGGWSLLLEPELATVRSGPGGGGAIEPELLPVLVARLMVDAPPEEVRVWNLTSASSAEIATWLPGVPLRFEDGVGSALELFAGAPWRGGLNLLQGEFAARGRWDEFKLPVGVLAAVVVVWLAGRGVVGWLERERLTAMDREFTTRIEASYRKVFPKARLVVNPRARVERALAERGSGGDDGEFLELLGLAGGALIPLSEVVVEGVSFGNGELELQLATATPEQASRAREVLEKLAGVKSGVKGSSTRGSQTITRLILRRGGGDGGA